MHDTCLSARIPTELPTFNTNGITDGLRMHATCPSALIPTEFPTVNTDGITDGPRMPDTCPSARIPTTLTDGTKKFGGIFDFLGAHFN
jgi:hypothetical protein